MSKIEQFLLEQAQTFEAIDYVKFIGNLLVTAVLAALLALFYIKFGNAISNRKRFARNFLPLALTTMLIITIVKSSVALSLGLVGALSIVRFRSAIKDPEELTYLFFTIAIGLAAGANKMLIAVIAFGAIMLILLIQAMLKGKVLFKASDNMILNITTSGKDMQKISETLGEIFSFVELKRMDDGEKQMSLSYVIEADNVEQLEEARTKLAAISPDMTISFIEQRNLAV